MTTKTKSWVAAKCFAKLSMSTQSSPGPLTAEEVASVLAENEFSMEVQDDFVVESYSTNSLAANNPTEDRSAEAKLVLSEGCLFGVFDGHGGQKCASVLATSLFNYVATALLPLAGREMCYHKQQPGKQLVKHYRDASRINNIKDEDKERYDELRLNWLGLLNRTKQSFTPEDSLVRGFTRMDADLGKAAEKHGSMLEAAMSGAVACIALVQGHNLYVAGTGDCEAVLGRQGSNGQWSAVKLTTAHTASNANEVERLIGQHPKEERKNILQENRLFGSLMPLRAFGDFRFKWPMSTLERVAVPIYGPRVIAANYRTPPYLTAKPDVVHRVIRGEDKFLVLATDGLWDVLSPEMVVQLVGDHKNQSPSKLRLNRQYYEQVFPRRCPQEAQEEIAIRPLGNRESSSSYLLRAALGGSLDLIARQLAIPAGEVRNIRDDITVTVVHLKSNATSSTTNDETFIHEKRQTERTKSTTPDMTSRNSQVSELGGNSEHGSMAYTAAKWEDIETAARLEDADDVNLDVAICSRGLIKTRCLKMVVDVDKKGDVGLSS